MQMTDRTPRDILLIGRVAARDSDAYREIFDTYAATVLGFLVQMLRDRAQAEEVLQDAFLQAWQQAARYRPERATPRGWLLMIARSRALDRLRASRSRAEREQRVGGDLASAAGGATPADEQLEATERRAAVSGALETLPDEQRRCIELAFYGGLTHRQIAERLEQPLGTVKSRILMGMSKLRQTLATSG
jgi:RNA polymerase sigma-70 factor (ECF subfamily)